MFYIYIDHETDELFYSNSEISDDDLYCETCGDMDRDVGSASSMQEALTLITNSRHNSFTPEEIAIFVASIPFE